MVRTNWPNRFSLSRHFVFSLKSCQVPMATFSPLPFSILNYCVIGLNFMGVIEVVCFRHRAGWSFEKKLRKNVRLDLNTELQLLSSDPMQRVNIPSMPSFLFFLHSMENVAIFLLLNHYFLLWTCELVWKSSCSALVIVFTVLLNIRKTHKHMAPGL